MANQRLHERILRERQNTRDYDVDSIEEIMQEYDVDASDALFIACCTMDGAHETESGTISSRQTACHVLGYDEDLAESEGQKKGKAKTRKDLAEEFKKYGINPKEVGGYDKAVDLLMEKMLSGK